MNTIFGNTMAMTEKSLDFLWKKEAVHATNLSNVDTPGYKSRYVTFEETYRSKLIAASGTRNRSSVARAIDNAGWTVRTTWDETSRLDENNVQTDVEITELSRTALQYQNQLNSLTSDVRRLSSAIKGQ